MNETIPYKMLITFMIDKQKVSGREKAKSQATFIACENSFKIKKLDMPLIEFEFHPQVPSKTLMSSLDSIVQPKRGLDNFSLVLWMVEAIPERHRLSAK